MNDAADAVSCLITTKVMSPLKAVAWAAFWAFMAYFIFNSHVAETMSHGIVENNYIDLLPNSTCKVAVKTSLSVEEFKRQLKIEHLGNCR